MMQGAVYIRSNEILVAVEFIGDIYDFLMNVVCGISFD